MIRVLIVDDHDLVRRGLRSYLATEADITVVGEAGSVAEAVALAGSLQPEVILLDLILPDGTGVEAAPQLLAAAQGARIVMLTSYLDDERVIPALRAGALSYLLKDVPAEEVAAAIRSASRGEAVLHPVASRRLTRELTGAGAMSQEEAAWASLTDREREVIDLIAAGRSNKEIGDLLYISERTVKSHVSNLLAKLSLQDRTQLAIAHLKRQMQG